MTFNTKTVEKQVIDNATTKEWLLSYEKANNILEASGFPRLRGCPTGHLLDIPGIAEPASAFASKIKQRETKLRGHPVSVAWTIHMSDGAIVVEATIH